MCNKKNSDITIKNRVFLLFCLAISSKSAIFADAKMRFRTCESKNNRLITISEDLASVADS